MAVLAAAAGALAAPLGLAGAYAFDAPAGPCIVLAAGALFAASALGAQLWRALARSH
jgi:zinc transport system permease protein